MRHFIVLLTACVALGAAASSVVGDVTGPGFYGASTVYRVTPDGNDGNGGTNWTSDAMETIGGAIDKAYDNGSGPTPAQIWVKGGPEIVYLETITLHDGISLLGGFAGTESSAGSGEWRWWQYPTVIDGDNTAGAVVTAATGGIGGLTIRNGAIGISVPASSAYTYVWHNIISNVGTCVSSLSYADVANNLLTGFSDMGVTTSSGWVRNNTIVGTGWYLCNFGQAVCGPLACVNGGECVNNIMTGCCNGEYVTSPITNDSWGNYEDAWSYGYGPTDISLDPRFANPAAGDYRLWSDSPCIDAGSDQYLMYEVGDLCGQWRILGEHIDIGAYEYSGQFDDFTLGLSLSADHAAIKFCEETVTVTAHATGSGGVLPWGTQVTFTTKSDPHAAAFENDSTTYTATADGDGYATAHLTPKSTCVFDGDTATAWVHASCTVHGVSAAADLSPSVTIARYSPTVTIAGPDSVTGPGEYEYTFTATHPDGSPYTNFQLTISTTAGYFVECSCQSTTVSTGSSGVLRLTLRLSAAESVMIRATYTDDCGYSVTVDKSVVYRVARWKNPSDQEITAGVNYSSPLVADLVPGGAPEVAVVSNSDGRIHVWSSTGAEVWGPPASPYVDSDGNNTLSAANVDSNPDGYLRLAGPYATPSQMCVFGYDAGSSSFKPLAGWPATSPFGFVRTAAALGDANLDGTTKVLAGDASCWVSCWNGTGQLLWRQVTDYSIIDSTVALGAISTTGNPNRPPEAVVGSIVAPGLWGFEGDEWRDYWLSPLPGSQCYNYTSRWVKPDGVGIGPAENSPAIGPIDGDGINDIAVGTGYELDSDGKLWVWLSGDSTWHSYSPGGGPINSSPVIVDVDGQHTIIFGCDNGRVYRLRWNSTAGVLEDVAGWTGGILLHHGFPVKASPVIGDVMNVGYGEPQVVVGCTDGNVYALWIDGRSHAGGNPVAHTWTCAQTSGVEINATPTICSLGGSQPGMLSLIVGSTDGMYKIDLYSTTFQPNTSRWPWPTFHRDAARTGCYTNPSTTMVSASIVGQVTSQSSGMPIHGASVKVEWYDGSAWVIPAVYGRADQRYADPQVDYVTTAGIYDNGSEINEGGFVINQLPPSRSYRLTVSKSGYTQTQVMVSVTTGAARQDVAL